VARGQRRDAIALAVEERLGRDNEPIGAKFSQRRESLIQVLLRAGVQHGDANSQGTRDRRRFLGVNLGSRTGWIDEKCNRGRRRHHFLQELRAFAYDFSVQKTHPGDVATRPVETGNETDADWFAHRREHDGNGRGRSFSSECRGRPASRKQRGHTQLNEFGTQNRQPVVVAFRPTKGNDEILPLDESRFSETSPEGCEDARGFSGRAAAEKSYHRHRRLLCARREWTRGRRAAEQRDEVAPLHSITSSARARNIGGTSTGRALAVLRLITSSNVVGWRTGRSAGRAPLRICAAYAPY